GVITVSVSSVAGTVTGNVDLKVDGIDKGLKALSSGSVTYTVSGLNAGSHSLTATYAAQGDFAKANDVTGALTVNKANTGMTNLAAPTIAVATATTALGGTIAAGTLIPTGSQVSISLKENITASLSSAIGGTLAGGTYFYVVSALTPQGTLTSPEASITIGSGTNNEVQLSWTTVPGATRYQVY